MNREIKFRGRDERGYWHIGWLVETNDGRIYIAENDEGWTDDGFHNDDFSGWYNVLEKTVGQFTGLLDKNGEEIYEGDIIQGEYDFKHLIRYTEEDARFTATLVEYVGDKFSERCNTGDVTQKWINEFNKVVIGNIHDNPELIKD